MKSTQAVSQRVMIKFKKCIVFINYDVLFICFILFTFSTVVPCYFIFIYNIIIHQKPFSNYATTTALLH